MACSDVYVLLTSFCVESGFEFLPSPTIAPERGGTRLGELKLRSGGTLFLYITPSAGIAGNEDPRAAFESHYGLLIAAIRAAGEHPLDYRIVSTIIHHLVEGERMEAEAADLRERIQTWSRVQRLMEVAKRVAQVHGQILPKPTVVAA